MRLLPLAIDLLGGTARSRLSGVTTMAKCYAIVGALAAIAAVFALVALTILLSEEVGAVYACLIMSAIFAIAALFVLLLHSRRHRRKQIRRVERAALMATAEKPGRPDVVVLAEAFVNGFLNRRS